MRQATHIAFFGSALALSGPLAAGECIRRPEGFQLRSDTVNWEITIGVGSECLQGLRGRTMLIDAVKIVEMPKAGKVTISGPSFRYAAPLQATSDSFKLEVTGEDHRIRGASIIRVDVAAR
jgi:hypothetical protein